MFCGEPTHFASDIIGIVVDMLLVLKKPKHVGRLLLHVVEDGDFLWQVVDFRNLGNHFVDFYFDVVIHIFSKRCYMFSLVCFGCKDTTFFRWKGKNTYLCISL